MLFFDTEVFWLTSENSDKNLYDTQYPALPGSVTCHPCHFSLDVALNNFMKSCPADTISMTRYVNDLLVCWLSKSDISSCESLVRRTRPELALTKEEPMSRRPQYLDLKISLNAGLCRDYGRKTPKPLLLADSLRAKSVKKRTVKTLLTNVFRRLCEREVLNL